MLRPRRMKLPDNYEARELHAAGAEFGCWVACSLAA